MSDTVFTILTCLCESESISHLVLSNSVTPRTVACQAPLSMEFSWQEYWNGWPFPSPKDLPDPGIELGSPAFHGVAKSRTQLSEFTFTFHFHALEKEMATHSSVLAWRIPGTEEPGGLPSMGSHRVGHD